VDVGACHGAGCSQQNHPGYQMHCFGVIHSELPR
jgi:hypothetical protein